MSQTYQVAHIREQGQQVILIVVDSSFTSLGTTAQKQQYALLQRCASAAGLAGAVALVWITGGRLASYGPTPWRSFLQGLDPLTLQANINRTLTCG
jgi:hypothetical protein